RINRLQASAHFLHHKPVVTVYIFVNKQAELWQIATLAAIVHRPKPAYLRAFQYVCHQFGSTFFIADVVRFSQKVLLLLVYFVVGKMAFHTSSYILRLTYVDGFASSIVEIINTG